jgi:predicted O-methyltransferase YrrM
VDEVLAEITKDQFLFNVRNYVPSAWIGHAPFLKFIIREFKPRSFVELGTHNGFSYFVGAQAIQESGRR